jgi:hypothetical protein
VDADPADPNVTIEHASALSASIRIAAHYAIRLIHLLRPDWLILKPKCLS